jgi:glycosyltransferase involved in cell wall biosynthesis
MKSIDVLMPFHRYDNFLLDAISSVEDSQNVHIHLILIDDRALIDQFPVFVSSIDYTYCSTSGNQGYGVALELGSRFIKTNHVALMNSDDLVTPDRFSSQIQDLEKNDLSITNIQKFSVNSRNIDSVLGNFNLKTFNPIFLIFGAYGANASLAARTEWWKQNFFFDSMSALDWRIALRNYSSSKIGYLPKTHYFYRVHAGQVTKNDSALTDDEEIFLEWNQFLSSYGIPGANISAFYFLGLPQKSSLISDWNEIFEIYRIALKNTTTFEEYTLVSRFFHIRVLISLQEPRNLLRIPLKIIFISLKESVHVLKSSLRIIFEKI